jgi:K+-transporting ATPase KdpF subunit
MRVAEAAASPPVAICGANERGSLTWTWFVLVWRVRSFWARSCSWPFASDFEGDAMTALYAVSLIIAAVLMIYLFVALLKPEWFS